MRTVAVQTHLEVRVEATGDYSPGQREVRYFADGTGQPGEPESVEITSVHLVAGDARIELPEAVWDEVREELECELLDAYVQERQADAEAYHDARREEKMLLSYGGTD